MRLAGEVGGARMLDYGCGDATFLDLLTQSESAPRVAVGAERWPSALEVCRERFRARKGLHFILTEDLERPAHAGSYDAIYCMEVLQYVTDPASVLEQFDRLLADGGALVISVPVETGLPLVVKQIVRRVAGWRGIGLYPGTSRYTLSEFWKSVIAGSTPHITRPTLTRADGSTYHDHTGFNWRVLRGLIRDRFDLVSEMASPVARLGPNLAAQCWFVARKRKTA